MSALLCKKKVFHQRVYQNANVCEQGEEVSHQCERSQINFLIEQLVHKLLATVTRFFVSFIKIPVLLQISVLKKLCLVRA